MTIAAPIAGATAAECWPEQPYPGARPARSYALTTDRMVHPVTVDATCPSGWRVGGQCLDGWLAEQKGAPLAERIAVLTYGSNANPMKLLAMTSGGLALPIVLLRCRTEHLAAVWCAGRRMRDGLPPATITPAPGRIESHFVALCTRAQVRALDRWEGRGERYDRRELAAPARVLVGRQQVRRVHAYVGIAPHRAPLLDAAGQPLPVAEVPRSHATDLLA